MILALRTDQPTTELYILSLEGEILHSHTWLSERQLAQALPQEVMAFLRRSKVDSEELIGIVVYSGSGSFTGLRIGTAVANALAYSLGIKVAKTLGDSWLSEAPQALAVIKCRSYVVPDYDRAPNIS